MSESERVEMTPHRGDGAVFMHIHMQCIGGRCGHKDCLAILKMIKTRKEF